MEKLISELQVGDVIDLEGDEYADPNQDVSTFQMLYVEVASVEVESPGCIAVGIEGVGTFGFPPTHTIYCVADSERP